MLLVFLLFWVLLIWGLIDGDIYAREAAILVVIWLVLAAGFFFLPKVMIPTIIGMVLVDIVLLFKVVGQDVLVR